MKTSLSAPISQQRGDFVNLKFYSFCMDFLCWILVFFLHFLYSSNLKQLSLWITNVNFFDEKISPILIILSVGLSEISTLVSVDFIYAPNVVSGICHDLQQQRKYCKVIEVFYNYCFACFVSICTPALSFVKTKLSHFSEHHL